VSVGQPESRRWVSIVKISGSTTGQGEKPSQRTEHEMPAFLTGRSNKRGASERKEASSRTLPEAATAVLNPSHAIHSLYSLFEPSSLAGGAGVEDEERAEEGFEPEAKMLAREDLQVSN
jgi:hypothetical protein